MGVARSAIRCSPGDSLFTVPSEILMYAPWEPVMDVYSDGSRFLMLKALPRPTEEADPQEQDYRLVLIENFWEELKARRRGSR